MLKDSTTAIPIVIYTSDPVELGLVASLRGPAATSRASVRIPASQSLASTSRF